MVEALDSVFSRREDIFFPRRGWWRPSGLAAPVFRQGHAQIKTPRQTLLAAQRAPSWQGGEGRIAYKCVFHQFKMAGSRPHPPKPNGLSVYAVYAISSLDTS